MLLIKVEIFEFAAWLKRQSCFLVSLLYSVLCLLPFH